MDRDYLMRYLNTKGDDIAWDFIRCGYGSVSRTCITLIQASSHTSPANPGLPRCNRHCDRLVSLTGTGGSPDCHRWLLRSDAHI